MARILLSGTAHTIPADLRKALTASPSALAAWNSLTLLEPRART